MSIKNLIIAFGGSSPEHEVSVLTAMQIFAAMDESDFELVPLYVTKSGKWLSGDSLKDLGMYKDLKTLETECYPVSFTKMKWELPISQNRVSQVFSRKIVPFQSMQLYAFHGSEGENGAFQGVCEQFNIPYTGSGVLASSVGMDKVKQNNFVRQITFQ